MSWVQVEADKEAGGESRYLREVDIGLGEYLRCLRSRDYSLLMNDGGLLQVSADFRHDLLEAYRFCYLPCAVHFEVAELKHEGELYPLEDFIEDLNADELRTRLRIRPPFRFELDRKNAAEDHPVSHVHFGRTDARVPVSAPLCWDHFARFIFSRFYPEAYTSVADLIRFPVAHRLRTISSEQAKELHMAFITT